MRSLLILAVILTPFLAFGQKITGTITGTVYDHTNHQPLDYAAVAAGNLTAYTDSLGRFEITNLDVGRHDVKVTYAGYNPVVIPEVMVSSAHVTPLLIGMSTAASQLKEIVVTDGRNRMINRMAIAGGTRLDMSEAGRFAGSMDDPGRLASTMAGISTDVSHNGLAIHGIAPHLMQWRLEGAEIPNPNHYADIATLGGGILSSLSSYVLGNSDFYAGTSPAQYVNALSGVFDMQMRSGNDTRYQHAFQVGVLGLDLASEGPIGKKGGASYIFNYRYSATGLLENLKVMDAGGTFNYQDLNFKINLPTAKCGTFSWWGTMYIDKFKDQPDERTEWLYTDDGTISSTDQWMAASGIRHKIRVGSGILESYVSAVHSSNAASMEMSQWDRENFSPYIDADKRQTDIAVSTSWLGDVCHGWTMKNGATFTQKIFDLRMKKAPYVGAPMQHITDGKGNAALASAYTDNIIRITRNVELGAGLNLMWLTLNNKFTVQPRLSCKWLLANNMSLTAATGLYSRMENMDVYFTDIAGKQPNKDLGFTQAWHNALAWETSLSGGIKVKVSPFLHYLVNVPCGIDDSYSILNQTDFYIDRALVNEGKGSNYGVDLSVERKFAQGWYSQAMASIFRSRYRGGDGVWHNTRFDRRYIANILGGKEWYVGHNGHNVLSVNGRLTYQGGDRYTPIDTESTLAHPDKEVQYDESRAYSLSHKPMLLFSFSASIRINKRHVTHIVAVDMLNAGGYSEPIGHAYNHITGVIDILRQKTFLPNLYYRIEF